MGRFLRHALALAVLLAVLLPFLWMAYAAFMPKEAVYSGELLSLLETFWALLLPFAASPFVIYLVYQGMRAVPEELLEAAKLDGAGHRVLLFRILLPLVRPTLVAAGVLAFAAHWNLVLYPRVVVSDPGLWTLQTWLTDLQRKYPTDWGLLSAAALLSVLPIALLYLLFERRVVATFEEGLKG